MMDQLSTMDSEEYYDSLDEDDMNQSTTDADEDTNIIPFYETAVNKNRVSLKNTSSKSSSVISTIPGNKLKRMQIRSLESKSYLDIYYEKNKIKKIDVMSTRATVTTPKSYRTCESFTDDLSEFYLKSEIDSSRTDSPMESPNSNKSHFSYNSSSTNKAVLESISARAAPTPQRNKITTKSSPISTYPYLGTLGPQLQLEKLELYRKRQQYGRQVNQANKIKSMEKRVLQNLKQEIQKSRDEIKKMRNTKISSIEAK